ncbi:MAG TPA: acyl-[acyl-carrier-protein]--UDP-N-acetylglucosamine O-acyltransferase, partial [Paludibacteraceae bacterium]|nr:acyl-[acyl-carrier-protein]--UDP-N-acetylglucosamine O-acyltransferase [Paludibacteraceae bacterium]
IGCHVMVQGGTRFGKDVPPYITIGRDPAVYAGLNSIGLRRRGFTDEQIHDIQEMYRLIYQSGLNVSQALARIEEEINPSEVKDVIVNFIKTSQRGLIKGGAD